MKETIKAKLQVKDSEGKVQKDDEGNIKYINASMEFDFKDNLDQAVKLCGKEAVFSLYKTAAKTALQNAIRIKLGAGFDHKQIQKELAEWKPGVIVERGAVDPKQAILKSWDSWSEEEKVAFLAELTKNDES